MEDLGIMILLATRYSFPRNTGAASKILQFLEKNLYHIYEWEVLTRIMAEAKETLENCDDIDRESIQGIIDLIEERMRISEKEAQKILKALD